jgi:hypothetical protein
MSEAIVCLGGEDCTLVEINATDLIYITTWYMYLLVLTFLIITILDVNVVQYSKVLPTAHNCVCLSFLIHMCTFGTFLWINTSSSSLLSAEEKFYNYSEDCQLLLQMMIGYMLYSVTFMLCDLKQFFTWLSFLHHICVIILSIFGLLPFGHYNAPYFVGVVEISTIFLTITHIFKDFPYLQERYSRAYTTIRVLFAFSFLITRVILFVPLVMILMMDAWTIFNEEDGVDNYFVFSVSILSTLFLTWLQLHWGWLILKKMIQGKYTHIN